MLATKPLDSVSEVTNGTQELYKGTAKLRTNIRERASTLLLVEDEPVARLRGEYVLSALGSAFHIAGDEVESIYRLGQLIHSNDGIVEIWLDNTFPTSNGDNRGSRAILEYIINNKYQNKVRIVTFGGSEEENLGVIRMCIMHGIPVSFDSRSKNEKLIAPRVYGLGNPMQTVTALRDAANQDI